MIPGWDHGIMFFQQLYLLFSLCAYAYLRIICNHGPASKKYHTKNSWFQASNGFPKPNYRSIQVMYSHRELNWVGEIELPHLQVTTLILWSVGKSLCIYFFTKLVLGLSGGRGSHSNPIFFLVVIGLNKVCFKLNKGLFLRLCKVSKFQCGVYSKFQNPKLKVGFHIMNMFFSTLLLQEKAAILRMIIMSKRNGGCLDELVWTAPCYYLNLNSPSSSDQNQYWHGNCPEGNMMVSEPV